MSGRAVRASWSGSRPSRSCHVFHPIAEGQIRGVPWVAPAMVRLWLLDQYDDAELDRKKVAAMFAGFVTRPGRTLGGLAYGLTYGRPKPSIEAVAGAPAIKSATLTVTVDYEADAPLG